MVSYWFDSKYSRRSFSLKHKLKLVDRKLLSIKPPREFRRSPHSIANSVKFWKASEYRAWLLFYSLPIVHHYSLLVYAMHILLGSEISPDQLDIAEKLLKCFYHHMPDLYGTESCKMNTHSLIHLATFVRMWGPLWVYSCFGFENMNGYLKNMFHGTRQILGQLVFTVKAQQALAFQYNFLSNESHVTMNFIDQYVRHQKQSPGHIFLGR